MDRCLVHRADLMSKIMRQAIARPGRPSSQANALLRAAMESTADDFTKQTQTLAGIVGPVDRPRVLLAASAFCTLGYALVGEGGETIELESLRSLSDRASVGMHERAYNGWTSFLPLMAPERAPQIQIETLLGQDRAYLEGMRLPNTNVLGGAFDYWRIYEAGVAVSAESYREDYVRTARGGSVPYLNVLQVLWRLHSLLAHARLIGQENPGVQQLIVRMDWRGLAGRMLMWDYEGSYASPCCTAGDRFLKTLTPQESPHFENGVISRLFGPHAGRKEGP
jgi:hypothetical protein